MPADICVLAIQQQAYLSDFIRLEEHTQKVRELLKDRAQREGLSEEGCLLIDQKPNVQKELAKQIQLGVEFFEHLSSALDFFEEGTREEVKNFLVQRLQKYGEYAKILNNKVDLEYNTSLDRIGSLVLNLQQRQVLEQASELKKSM